MGAVAMPAVIHIVDDDASFQKSLAQLLQALGYEVVRYASAEQLLETPPDARLGCILLDVRMPGLSGPDLQDRLTQLGSSLPIIFLSGHGTVQTSVRVIKAGAEDFLLKPIAKKELLNAIGRALDRCRAALAQRERMAALQARLARLTPRERKVFALVARGQINKQIAFALGTTERTIKAHRQKVMHKLNAQSLLELAAIADGLGIFTAGEDAEPSNQPQALSSPT
jgi:FixJ family two-component response regulator